MNLLIASPVITEVKGYHLKMKTSVGGAYAYLSRGRVKKRLSGANIMLL